MLEQVAKGREFVSFKCHAHLFNFAAPIRIHGKVEFVLLGGRVFRNYQDFSAFAKKASEYGIRDYFFEDWENSVRFQNATYFERATHFIQSMIDSLTSDSTRLDQAKKREYRMNTLYDLSSVLSLGSLYWRMHNIACSKPWVYFLIFKREPSWKKVRTNSVL